MPSGSIAAVTSAMTWPVMSFRMPTRLNSINCLVYLVNYKKQYDGSLLITGNI